MIPAGYCILVNISIPSSDAEIGYDTVVTSLVLIFRSAREDSLDKTSLLHGRENIHTSLSLLRPSPVQA